MHATESSVYLIQPTMSFNPSSRMIASYLKKTGTYDRRSLNCFHEVNSSKRDVNPKFK